jgi:hypothetical protein
MAFTSKEDEDFFAAIGRLTISWARIELGLDCAVDVVHHVLGGQKINATAPKTSLYRKIEYLRRWAKTVPEPTFRDALPPLLAEIEEASVTRNDLIHGVVLKMDEGTGEAQMARIIHGYGHSDPPFEKKYFKVTTIDILKAAVAADKLSNRSVRLGTDLQDLIPVLQAEIDNVGREVGG